MIVEDTDDAPLVTKCIGFQSSSKTLRIACAANFAVTPEIRTSALLARRVTICEIDRGIGDFIGYRLDERFISIAQHVTQAVDEILTEVIVLIQQRKFCIRLLTKRIFGKDLGFGP